MTSTKITNELIESGRSARGGWSRAQLAILGVPWPPPSGWKKKVIGNFIKRSEADHFLELRGQAVDSQPSAKVITTSNIPDLDEIYADTWGRRDQLLNGITYGEYLESKHWAEVKTKANRRNNYKKCEFCDSTKVELHHTSYKWVMTDKELQAIISLCRMHHQEVHDVAKSQNISVRLATNILRRKYKPEYWLPNRVT